MEKPRQGDRRGRVKVSGTEVIVTVRPSQSVWRWRARLMKQTRARIFRHDTSAEGKIFSLFEPSTEIIRKGKAGKPNEFGKMVKLQEAENQIIIDY